MHPTIARVTERIETRSQDRRNHYLERMRAAADAGPRRAHLTCGNQAHAYAAMGDDKPPWPRAEAQIWLLSAPITICCLRISRLKLFPI